MENNLKLTDKQIEFLSEEILNADKHLFENERIELAIHGYDFDWIIEHFIIRGMKMYRGLTECENKTTSKTPLNPKITKSKFSISEYLKNQP